MVTIINLSNTQPTRLHNQRCAYCNAAFEREGEPEKEHVVGKNFVPKGMHEQQWNLHLNSCHKCNQTKSALENDLSAITMVGGLLEPALKDTFRASEAKRKSKAVSQRTGKKVADSFEELTMTGDFGNAEIKINMILPPQLDESRAFLLVQYQMRGFFFQITYNQEKEMGYCWPGAFMPLAVVPKSDWGNPLVLSFSEKTKDWEFRLGSGEIAQGYYGVLIKKHPKAALWSWAVEWNKTTRLFGFFGDEEVGGEIIGTLTATSFGGWIEQPDGSRIRSRLEKPVDPADSDHFFYSQ